MKLLFPIFASLMLQYQVNTEYFGLGRCVMGFGRCKDHCAMDEKEVDKCKKKKCCIGPKVVRLIKSYIQNEMLHTLEEDSQELLKLTKNFSVVMQTKNHILSLLPKFRSVNPFANINTIVIPNATTKERYAKSNGNSMGLNPKLSLMKHPKLPSSPPKLATTCSTLNCPHGSSQTPLDFHTQQPFPRLDIYQQTGLQNILYQLKITGTVHSCPRFASPLPTLNFPLPINQTTDEGVEGYVSYSPRDSHSFTPVPECSCGSMESHPYIHDQKHNYNYKAYHNSNWPNILQFSTHSPTLCQGFMRIHGAERL
eukprot:bmy_08927T0